MTCDSAGGLLKTVASHLRALKDHTSEASSPRHPSKPRFVCRAALFVERGIHQQVHG
jgi:hypothetical protein